MLKMVSCQPGHWPRCSWTVPSPGMACATMHRLKQKGASWDETPWKGSGAVTVRLCAGENCTSSLVGLFIMGDSIIQKRPFLSSCFLL